MRILFQTATTHALAVGSVLLLVSGANAQTSFTALYDFTGAPGSQTNTAATPTTVPAGLTASILGRGPGITAAAAGSSIASNGFNSGTTLVADDFYTFSLTPSAANTLSLTTLAFSDQRSATGPQNFSIRSSADGFSAEREPIASVQPSRSPA